MTREVLRIEIQSSDGQWVRVGHLVSENDRNTFYSDPAYWATANRPVLGQILEENGPAWQPSTVRAIPRWFGHLLPEGRLRTAVAEIANVNVSRDFPLLARLGADDLPGAVRAVHEEPPKSEPSKPHDESSARHEPSDPLLKFSLAGAQMKFSLWSDGKGLTLPVRGKAGNMILKLPDTRQGAIGVPRAEFAAMSLASAAEFDVPRISLIDAAGVEGLGRWGNSSLEESFLIERFDRKGERRIHAEEFAQVVNAATQPDTAKYRTTNIESIAAIAALLIGPAAAVEVIHRTVLNVLVGNGDAHVKNWALVYPDGRTPAMSPLYDVVPTVLYLPDDDLGLNLNGSKSFEQVTAQSFRRLGERANLGAARAEQEARIATERVLSRWNVLSEHLPSDQFLRLSQRLKTLHLVNL